MPQIRTGSVLPYLLNVDSLLEIEVLEFVAVLRIEVQHLQGAFRFYVALLPGKSTCAVVKQLNYSAKTVPYNKTRRTE